MSTIAIVSDSTASLSNVYVRERGICVVPLYLRIGDSTYRDGVDITPSQFYERLPQCNPLPTTSQPSVGDLSNAYRQALEGGAEGIISIHLSSEISGTVNSARLAAEQLPDAAIEIVDTRCAAAAQQIVIEAVANATEQGAGFEAACAVAHQAVAAQRTVFTVDTLEYLYKGGRIGGAAALFGSLLQFKPLLHFEDGRITALERVRKAARAMERMVEIMEGWLPDDAPNRVLIMQAACPERAQALEDVLRRSHIAIDELEIVPLSPVIGAHVGNGTLGLCCLPMAVWSGKA